MKSRERCCVAASVAVLVCGVAIIGEADGAELGNREGRQWRPYLEWSLSTDTFEGNPFDLVATVTFVHPESGEKRTTEMFHDDGQTWKFRFTGTRPGQWEFTTSSADPELDGHRGTVTVAPNDRAYGFVTHSGNKWARPFGSQGELRAFLPQYVMYDGPAAFHNKPERIAADIRTFLVEHGFTGFHVPVSCRWFDLEQERSDAIHVSDPTPDYRTFQALELLIKKTHAAGGVVHLWAWGDEQRTMTPARWGINGKADKRLQRYIAARLGPLPGWTIGYGFDLDEWVNVSELEVWRDCMHDHLGWPHLFGGRPAGPNRGTDHSQFERWNKPLDYASFEHHRPTYEVYVAVLEGFSDKPSLSEDRFRIRQSSRYASKDYSMETTRQGLWQSTMAGGVANIWGNLIGPQGSVDTNRCGSFPYPKPHWIKTYSEFFRDRFFVDMVRDNRITNGACLKRSRGTFHVFYKEDTASIRMDLSEMPEARLAVAVDALKPYREIELGKLSPEEHVWKAPYRSDWAVAVGDDAAQLSRGEKISELRSDARPTKPDQDFGDGPVAANPSTRANYEVVAVENTTYRPNELFLQEEDLCSPRFKDLRSRYRLDEVVGGQTDEFQRILLLRNWIRCRIVTDESKPAVDADDALQILENGPKGGHYHCGHISKAQNAVMNAMGYVTRCVFAGAGEKEARLSGAHGINEVWSNTYCKWILMDAELDSHFEKDGMPLSGLEIRDEVLRDGAANVVRVRGPERKPVARVRDDTWGQTPRTYAWISWYPDGNRHTIWPKQISSIEVVYDDEYWRTHTWYRNGKKHWAYDAGYFRPVEDRRLIEWTPNVLDVTACINGDTAEIQITSCTPNLKEYQINNPDGEWRPVKERFTIHLVGNREQRLLRSVNLVGVCGPEYELVIEQR